MIKIGTEKNLITGDEISKYVLDCGLKFFSCRKKDFKNCIGMFGTEYGSIDNEFKDVITGAREKVPEGIAHFLEHKLFEQEGENALDLFARMGVSANAYTSFDHTVYFFETTSKIKECLIKLVELVTTPYFTVKNVEKEKGIIMQELKMYEDDPMSVVYYNTLKAMYVNHPLNIDIVGTRDSITRITKENLYTCYNTFYSLNNMFFIVIGDIDPDETAEFVNEILNSKRKNIELKNIERYRLSEPEKFNIQRIEKKLDIFMPYISFGFKLLPNKGIDNKINRIITKIIECAYFSKMSDLYEKMYKEGIINDDIELEYGYGKDYSYLVILGCSLDIERYRYEVIKKINDLKQNGISKDLFEIARNKMLGEQIYEMEDLMSISRQVIDSVIQETKIFSDMQILKDIQMEDVNKFIEKAFKKDNMVESIVNSKESV